MNPAVLKENWPVLQAKLRRRFDDLGDEDVVWPRDSSDRRPMMASGLAPLLFPIAAREDRCDA